MPRCGQRDIVSKLYCTVSVWLIYTLARAWAIAAANAYRTYADTRWLNMAVAVWNAVNDGCVITANVASSGSIPIKNVTVPAECNGSTLFLNIVSERILTA